MASPSTSQNFPPGYLEQDSSARLCAACTVILCVTTILVALRIYTRRLTTGGWGWDDALIAPAWLLVVGTCITGYLDIKMGGAGRHVEAVVMENPAILITRGKLLFSLEWISGFSNTFSRISLLCLFLRVFKLGFARIASWIVIVYLLLFVSSQVIATSLTCRPLAFFWDQTIEGGTCFNQLLYYKMCGFLNILGDVAIMLLPVHTVWNLHTSLARRAGIAAVFLSGSVGLIASCIRTSSFFTSASQFVDDPTWADVDLMSWTVVESGMYTAAACLVGLRPLLSHLPSWLKKYASTEEPQKYTPNYEYTPRNKEFKHDNSDQDSLSAILAQTDKGRFQGQEFDTRKPRDDLYASSHALDDLDV